MQTDLYIPKKITVGFQKRSDTFTGKLGYVVYRDEKGVLRQEKSWQGWRDQKIAAQEFDNTPRSNFVFNRDISRCGHWSTHSKVRIHDSRDFEFEIELSNMMYILMHSDVSKRDIQEDCVFAWSGKNLVLLPVTSEEYKNSVEHTKKLEMKFSFKDLVPGHTYTTKKRGDFVYLGSYEWSIEDYSYSTNKKNWKNTGKKHIFYALKKLSYMPAFEPLTAADVAECIQNEVHPGYSNFVEKLMKTPHVKKRGIFAVKKGFETVGYKRGAYESFEVTLVDPSNGKFQIKPISLDIDNDQPKIVYAKNERNRYSSYHGISNDRLKEKYLSAMKEKGVKASDFNAVKYFFEEAGFGTLYYTNTKGSKEVVGSKT